MGRLARLDEFDRTTFRKAVENLKEKGGTVVLYGGDDDDGPGIILVAVGDGAELILSLLEHIGFSGAKDVLEQIKAKDGLKA